jgi:hypothetical protein
VPLSEMAAISLTSQFCQKCRYIVSCVPIRTYLEDETYNHEACLQVNWEEILQMKDSCRLCLENYKNYTNFLMSRRAFGGEIHWAEPNYVVASKHTPINSSEIQHLLFKGYSENTAMWLLKALVCKAVIGGECPCHSNTPKHTFRLW